MSALYKFSNVSKIFSAPGENLEILKNINLVVEEGEALAIVGTSGSGKSPLLHLMGALDTPSTGAVYFDGQDMTHMTPDQKAAFRNKTLGFVFQFHHLLPAFTALENVTLSALMAEGRVSATQRERARELLAAVGLAQAMDKRPGELSGGMQQRVAIARALVHAPPLVLADEPTGNLDTAASDAVFALLRDIHDTRGTAFVIVTHDPRLAARCDRVVELVDGRIARDEPTAPATERR